MANFIRLLILLSTTCVVGCAEEIVPVSTLPTKADVGPILTVGLQSWPESIQVQGSLYGDEQAVVGTKVAGQVESVNVDIGSVVKQGDILAVLNPDDFDLRIRIAQAQVSQIRAKLGVRPDDDDMKLDRLKAPPVRQERTMLEDARGKVERGRSLLSRRAASVEEVQDLEAALRVAEARYDSSLNLVEEQIALLNLYKQELAQVQQARNDATIRAPFAGVIQHRYAAPGVYLSVGAAVATLVRTNILRYRAGVPEREALRVAVGQPASLIITGLKTPISGSVTRISPALDLTSRALIVEVDVPNGEGLLRSGLFAEGHITVNSTAQTIVVPPSAVSEFAGVEKVWKIVDGTPVEVRVRIGRRDKERLEVREGLVPGEQILATASR